MRVGVVVIAKESFQIRKGAKMGQNAYTASFSILETDVPGLKGKLVKKYVEKDFYDSLEVTSRQIIDLEIDVKEAYNKEYADLHLDVEILGFAEDLQPVPEETGTKPEHPAEPAKPADKHKTDTGGKEEK